MLIHANLTAELRVCVLPNGWERERERERILFSYLSSFNGEKLNAAFSCLSVLYAAMSISWLYTRAHCKLEEMSWIIKYNYGSVLLFYKFPNVDQGNKSHRFKTHRAIAFSNGVKIIQINDHKFDLIADWFKGSLFFKIWNRVLIHNAYVEIKQFCKVQCTYQTMFE